MLIFVHMQLSKNKTDYLFDHLRQHWVPDKRVMDAFAIFQPGEPVPEGIQGKIVFQLSDREEPQPVNVDFEGEGIPVLFPLSHDAAIFRLDAAGNLWFTHDYLSSAFYLLSGIQELSGGKRDVHGRFGFAGSIQARYGFISKPVVNYYFEFLLKGFETFASFHHFDIERRRLFENFGFLLSHDVDRVAYHHPRLIIYKILQILGLKPSTESKRIVLKQFFSGLRYQLNPGRGSDPWWNFDWMIDLEKRLGIRSTFFFLHKEDGRKNAWYAFESPKIKCLISELKQNNFEVGIHGTFKSVSDLQSLKNQQTALAKVYGKIPIGIRQHYLLFKHPTTFQLQEAAGLVYDSSLSFHDHDGYRNGYCYPFHPYDFEKDSAMKIWEIPLVMMEVSALQYRQLSYNELSKSVEGYIQEAQKFGGLFTLLWHNCRLNDDEYVGISKFYEDLLKCIVKLNPTALTGVGLIERCSSC